MKLMDYQYIDEIHELTLGKYDGTNYGLAIGATPASPDIVVDANGISVNTHAFLFGPFLTDTVNGCHFGGDLKAVRLDDVIEFGEFLAAV